MEKPYLFILISLCSLPAYSKYYIHLHNHSSQTLITNTSLITNHLPNTSFDAGNYALAPNENKNILWVNYNDDIKNNNNYVFAIDINRKNSLLTSHYTLTLHGDFLGSSITNIKNETLSWDNPKEKKFMDFSKQESSLTEIVATSTSRNTTQGIDDIDIVLTDKNPTHYKNTPDKKHLTLASYNIQIWPLYADPVNYPNHKELRTQIIPSFLKYYDIVAIEELFQNDTLNSLGKSLRQVFNERMEKEGFLYHSGPIDSVLLPLSSGVIIYSKWPIINSKEHQFTNCQNEDCLAAKGVSYIAINKNDQLYHIFATHLNAIQDDSQSIQKDQINEITTFITQLKLPINEPTLLMGDFNSPKRPINTPCIDIYLKNHVLNDALFYASDYLQQKIILAPIIHETNSLCFSAWPHYNSMNTDNTPALFDAIYLLNNTSFLNTFFKNRIYPLFGTNNKEMYPKLDLSDHYLVEADLKLK